MVPIYYSIRGQLNSYIQVCFYSGVLTGYIGGSYIDYGTNPIVMATIPFVFVAIFMFMPSSPQHLLKCDKVEVKKNKYAKIFILNVITSFPAGS